MKNQYFADERDYGKYDLLMEVVQKTHGLRRLTSIPMLTPDDESGEGDRIEYEQGCRRSDLFAFLRNCLDRNDRQLVRLRGFYADCGIEYRPYRDTQNISHSGRKGYFDSIEADGLNDALVFFDPDTGLEHHDEKYMAKKGIEKYLMWDDVLSVWTRMNPQSVGVIYQHLQKSVGRAHGDMLEKGKELCRRLEVPSAICVDQIEVAFYLFTRCQQGYASLLQLMPFYAGMVGFRYQVIANPDGGSQR